MNELSGFQKLLAWQRAFALCSEIYALVRKLPVAERYGLCDQMRRCAVSVVSNIAEGHDRRSPGDFSRFLNFSLGSSAELQTQILVCIDQQYLTDEDCATALSLVDEVRKLINGLRRKLKE